jgi:hypothetical protein
MIKGKGGFMENSFTWIFALVVGGFILFLAIFFAIRLTGTEETQIDVVTSKDIGILTNPLEIGFESGKTTFLSLPTETRIYGNCDNSGEFGTQKIRISQKSLGEWSETPLNISFKNKYLFSESPVEGRSFYLFSKPFEFPFKVADLIYLIPKNKFYCFVLSSNNPLHKDISMEIRNLKLDNVKNVTNANNCPPGSQKVCFTSTCNITVNLQQEKVIKSGENLSFSGSTLMYAAIFSDPDVYKCQLKRLMQRTDNLADLYEKKIIYVGQKGCNANFNLALLSSRADSYSKENTQEIRSIYTQVVKQINASNEAAGCKIW